MANALPRDEYMRLLYEQAAREQRELAERVRAARGSDGLAADFERWATAPDPALGICARPSIPLAARGTTPGVVACQGRGGTRRGVWGVWSTHAQPRSAARRVAGSCFGTRPLLR